VDEAGAYEMIGYRTNGTVGWIEAEAERCLSWPPRGATSGSLLARALVPEGHLTIAQRFNLKNARSTPAIPSTGLVGRQNVAFWPRATNRPFWTVCGACRETSFVID
jgi:hypothetical protein